MTHARLRETLRELPFVEGFSHQVIQGDHLSVEGVRTAARVWIERCFPQASTNLVVELWTGPDGISYEVLALILSSKTVRVASPAFEGGVEPDPNIVQPQYETAAA
ncbi:MAG TPA: hypothetical protein VH165_15040 [Kofleriaceae bacterium]|jgi:hypothetical protein|nr:hypothetical protein [Kofleriaceae bacterium]